MRRHRLRHGRNAGGAFAATLALSVHSVGDGVAIAVQGSEGEIVAIGLAVLAHKFFASYALGTMLASPSAAGLGRLYALLFVLATPLTIVVSVFLGVDLQGPAMQRATAVCAGTLLHVGIHEILEPHLDSHHFASPAIRLLPLWAGFASMSVLAIWV